MNIQIIKNPRTSFIKRCFHCVLWYSCLIFAFYFNYKFIDGNNFIDFIVFSVIIFTFFALVSNHSKNYYDVNDDKIEKIEEVINS